VAPSISLANSLGSAQRRAQTRQKATDRAITTVLTAPLKDRSQVIGIARPKKVS
jgi:hypothetical protein